MLERIERIKMGVSIEDAQEQERLRKLPLLDRVKHLKEKQSESKPTPIFGHIDTSKIPETDFFKVNYRK